jgi:uncharacterized protein YcbX
VSQIWRHPVKSMQGESLDVGTVEGNGVTGDRLWAVALVGSTKVLTGRREPRLLEAFARLDGDQPVMTLPNGWALTGTGPAVDAALSEWLGQDVTLCDARQSPRMIGEFYEDPVDDTSPMVEWIMPKGRFVDALPLLLLTDASLRAGAALHPDGDWDVRRFRPNLFIEAGGDTWVEDAWARRRVRIGEVEVEPFGPCARCSMVTRAQPGLRRDLDVFRTLNRHHDAKLGMWTRVTTPGTVRVGDAVEVLD